MADKKSKKTGLGVDALFPPAEEEAGGETATSQTPPQPQAEPKARPKTQKATPKEEPEKKLPRRTAWLREDHLQRLEALKLRDRGRLQQEGKRVSLTTLIDEALERYLAEMET